MTCSLRNSADGMGHYLLTCTQATKSISCQPRGSSKLGRPLDAKQSAMMPVHFEQHVVTELDAMMWPQAVAG